MEGEPLIEAADSKCPQILLFDQSAESREVLRTLLERRGMSAVEAAGGKRAIRLAETVPFALIVADADSDRSRDGAVICQLRELAVRQGARFMVLGGERQTHGPEGVEPPQSSLPSAQQGGVPKPYHYAGLLHTIEMMLSSRPAA